MSDENVHFNVFIVELVFVMKVKDGRIKMYCPFLCFRMLFLLTRVKLKCLGSVDAPFDVWVNR